MFKSISATFILVPLISPRSLLESTTYRGLYANALNASNKTSAKTIFKMLFDAIINIKLIIMPIVPKNPLYLGYLSENLPATTDETPNILS